MMSRNQMTKIGHQAAPIMILLSGLLMLGVSSTAFATTVVCKGMEQDVCEAADECRWQAGYTRKDGVEVRSHCRSSGKKKDAVPDAAAPEASAEMTTETTS